VPRFARRILAGLCLAFAAAVPAGAQGAGVVERNQTAFSPALGRPLAYNLYRPAEPPAEGARWPVIYLLEGRPSESDWLDQGFVYEVIDRAVADGVIPPSLVVIPVAPFSWYVDNDDPGGQGMMKTALTRDLVAAIDARFPTAACREGRAVGGLSMGGYGAVTFALADPGLYVGAMSFAGAITPPIEAGDRARLERADAFYDGAFGRPLERGRFNAWNPFVLLRSLPRKPGPKPAIFLAIGDRDRGGLLQSLTRFHVDLLRAGVDSTLRIGPGVHDWDTWRRQLADGLDWLGPRLDPGCRRDVANRPGDVASESASP
jgi:S-formylglutathione hydrolase FrmB